MRGSSVWRSHQRKPLKFLRDEKNVDKFKTRSLKKAYMNLRTSQPSSPPNSFELSHLIQYFKLTHRFSWCIHCYTVLQVPSISQVSFSLSLVGKHCRGFAASIQSQRFLQLCHRQEEHCGPPNHDGQSHYLIRKSAYDKKRNNTQ